MPSLYNLNADYDGLLSMIERGDFTQEEAADTLDMITDSINDKHQAIACVIRDIQLTMSSRDKEAERLESLNDCDSLTLRKLQSMLLDGISKHGNSSGLFNIKTAKTPSKLVIDDDKAISGKWIKTKEVTSVDKAGIKSALKAGEVVEGCHLDDGGIRLSIK